MYSHPLGPLAGRRDTTVHYGNGIAAMRAGFIKVELGRLDDAADDFTGAARLADTIAGQLHDHATNVDQQAAETLAALWTRIGKLRRDWADAAWKAADREATAVLL